VVAILWGNNSLNIHLAFLAPTFLRSVARPVLRGPTIGTLRHGSIASMSLAYCFWPSRMLGSAIPLSRM
jgi:hypothetical protein